jgi:putative phosphoesterase
MLIGVISDTHLGEPTDWLKKVYAAHLAGCDAIVHCGDVGGPGLWRWLEAVHGNVHAVAGNMDGWAHGGALPVRLSLNLGGLTLGAAHGWGPRSQVGEAVLASFGQGYDLVCYGHTHRFHWERAGQTWLLNPGSLQRGEASLALVAIGPHGQVECRQVRLE